jgi:hypothetical protein
MPLGQGPTSPSPDFAVAMLKRIILDGVVLAVMLTGAAAAG